MQELDKHRTRCSPHALTIRAYPNTVECSRAAIVEVEPRAACSVPFRSLVSSSAAEPLGAAGAVDSLGFGERTGASFSISFSACTSTMKFVWPFGILPAQRWRWSALSHEVELNWTGLLWLAVLPAIARSLAGESAASQVPTFNGAWCATIVIPLLIYGAVFHYMALRVPDIGNPSLKMLPIAWEELGEQVEKIETDLQRATGEARLRTELPRTLVPHPCLRQVSLHCPLNGEVHDFIKGCP